MEVPKQIQALASQGISRVETEATIGRKLTDEELALFRRANAVRKLKRQQKRAAGPKSVSERVAAHVARANELGDFNLRPRHPRLKERCRFDLEAFGWYYCRPLLKHRASEFLKNGLLREAQNIILNGGKSVVEFGRGGGKTTHICHIASLWASLYGHRRYPVVISATGALGKKNLKTIKYILLNSKEIAQDFPAVAVPLRKIGGVSQRSSSITYHGQAVNAEWSANKIVLPMLRDSRGRPLDDGCGAIISSVGIGGAIRGANEVGQRPDFIIIDDPQTRKIAHSPKMVEDVINYIHNDVLMLAGHDRVLSAFVTITPQCFGDVATELTSQSKHPEWQVTVEPFVKRTCPNWDDLVRVFCEAYVEDAAAKDTRFSRSRAWYEANREAFAEVIVIDPLQFDPLLEVDAVHHVLNLRASLGEAAFNAEVMMQVASAESELSLSADLVASRLNGVPRGVLPMGTSAAFAFCDINLQKGKNLSWCVTAFGKGHVSAVVAYGKYPEVGNLIRPGMSDDAKAEAVSLAMLAVARKINDLNLHDAEGRRVCVETLGFDCGYQAAAVHRTVFRLNSMHPYPFRVIAVKGFGQKARDMKKNVVVKGDFWFELETRFKIRNGKNEVYSYRYLGSIPAYWKEKAQSGFLETPLMYGSTSLYGSDAVKHFIFSSEVCGETLVRKYNAERGGKFETAWDWVTTGENHYLDALTGCFVLASRYGYYERTTRLLERRFKMVTPISENPQEPEEIKPHEFHQDELFDPSRNTSIGENTTYAEPSDEPAPARRHQLVNKLKHHVHKFKRGRYRR